MSAGSPTAPAGCRRARLLVEVIELLRRVFLVQPHAARAVSRLRQFGFIDYES
jgi:hypothetical protein